MFKFLKEKIKASIKSISEKIRKEKEVVEAPKEEVKEKPLEEITEARELPKEEIKDISKETKGKLTARFLKLNPRKLILEITALGIKLTQK